MLHGGIHITDAQTTFPGAQNIEKHDHVMQPCLKVHKKTSTKFFKKQEL